MSRGFDHSDIQISEICSKFRFLGNKKENTGWSPTAPACCMAPAHATTVNEVSCTRQQCVWLRTVCSDVQGIDLLHCFGVSEIRYVFVYKR